MTREEAWNRIDAIITKNEVDDEYVTITNGKDYDALRYARKVLEQEPTTKNNLGVDCISRAQALSELKESAEHHSNNSREEALLRRDRDIIRNLPSVTPQTKTGHWITTRTFMHDGEFYCDKCKCDAPNNEKWDYCPNCGAKMVEPQESEDKE